jgi:hypothetical protein
MPGSLSSEDSNQPKILDEVRQYLRLHHYSIHTERSYAEADKALLPMPTARLAEPFLVGHTRSLPERVRQFEAGASPGKDEAIDRDRDGRGRVTVLAFCMAPPRGAPHCRRPSGHWLGEENTYAGYNDGMEKASGL